MKNLKRFLVRHILKEYFPDIGLTENDKRNMSIVHFFTILDAQNKFSKLLLIFENHERFIS